MGSTSPGLVRAHLPRHAPLLWWLLSFHNTAPRSSCAIFTLKIIQVCLMGRAKLVCVVSYDGTAYCGWQPQHAPKRQTLDELGADAPPVESGEVVVEVWAFPQC